MNARRKDHWTPLHLACHYGKPEAAQVLLDHGANPNVEDDLLGTPLHHVAGGPCESREDCVRVAQLLLECGVDVNAQDTNRETPLHLASTFGRLEIVRLLLEHATVKNDRGQNAVHLDLGGKQLFPKIMLVLMTSFSLERGVDVNARKMDDWTPLHLASYYGRLEIARVLLDHGASVNAETNAGETPLFLVSRGVYGSQDDGARVAQLLLERGGKANAPRRDSWFPLHAASYFGKPEIVRMLLDHGAKANAESRQGKNSLDLVARGEYRSKEDGVRVAQLLLERGVDVNASDKDHWTPLHSASYYGMYEIVRVLLDHGAKVNAENDDHEISLDLVSRGKYPSPSDGVRIAQLLLDHGANVNGQPKGDWTPLSWSSYYGKPDIVRVLVDRGATVNTKNKTLRTPLHYVALGEHVSQDGVRVAQLLLECGADVNAQDIDLETPLQVASASGKFEIARVLLDHGAIAKVEDFDGETPLHVISRGQYDSQDDSRLAQLLIERGVDLKTLDKDLDTPLHLACYFGKLDIAQQLLDRGAAATTKNGRDETPLHVLLRGQCGPQDGVRLARLLLEHGADVNAPDTDDETPLHSACCYGKLDIARLLLSHGAAANAKNIQGETPLHVISTDGTLVAQLLLEQGVDVNIQDKHNRTPLGTASFNGKLEIVRLLLDHGATVNARDDFGGTPLHLSSQYQGDIEERGISVVRLLLEHGADIHARDVNHMTPLDLSSRRRWLKVAEVLREHGGIFFIYICEC